ncbi:MAG: DUF6090 family protein [Fidelibacterota bacterium]|jgi:hypothetical protein
MKHTLARGGIEFLAVFLGLAFSFNIDEWRQDNEVKNRLTADYINIQKDLINDITSLEAVISFQEKSVENGKELILMIQKNKIFNYEKFIEHLSHVWNSSTFFGTSSAYDASVSSGRLTYFGDDELGNEIGIIYGHFYSRMDLNGEQVDSFWYLNNIGTHYFGADPFEINTKKQNLQKIFSNEYLGKLKIFIQMQGGYVFKAKNALNQMRKVEKLLRLKVD